MESILIDFLEKTLRFKLRDCSLKKMLRSGAAHELWFPFPWFEYIVERGRGREGVGKNAAYVILTLFYLKTIPCLIYLVSYMRSLFSH